MEVMKSSKLLFFCCLTVAFVLCGSAFIGENHGSQSAAGIAAHSPGKTFGAQATDKAANKSSLRTPLLLADECRPAGANCSVPSDCCSGSCVPPGFGGQPTCQ
jgi:hypothetical protein